MSVLTHKYSSARLPAAQTGLLSRLFAFPPVSLSSVLRCSLSAPWIWLNILFPDFLMYRDLPIASAPIPWTVSRSQDLSGYFYAADARSPSPAGLSLLSLSTSNTKVILFPSNLLLFWIFWMIPWRRAWQPTPAFLPRESHGQRSLGGYSPQGWKVRPDRSNCKTVWQGCFCLMFWFLGREAWGIKHEPPTMEGEVLTTGRPGKSLDFVF